MKQVMEQYGFSIIATWIAILLMTVILGGDFFGGKGIPQVLGQVVEYSLGEKAIIENEAFENYKNTIPPTIVEKKTYIIQGKAVLLSDCFEAKSSRGNLLPVYVKRMWDRNGTEVDTEAVRNGLEIKLNEPGAYWLHVYTVDENNRSCERIVRLLVNER